MPVTRASIGPCIRCFPRFARAFPHVTCRRIRAGCTVFKGRVLVIGREKGASWRRWSGRFSPHRRLGLHRMLRFRFRLSERALHLQRVIAQRGEPRLPRPDFAFQIAKGDGRGPEFRFEKCESLLPSSQLGLAGLGLAVPFLQGVLPRRDRRGKTGWEVHPYSREECADGSPLLDPWDAVAQYDEPQVLDSKGSEGVLTLVEGDEMTHPVDGNRPTEIVILERAIVAKRIFAEQTSILAKDEDPFVVDPRDHPRSLDHRAPDDRRAISRDGPLLHHTHFHHAPPPRKYAAPDEIGIRGLSSAPIAPGPLSHPTLRPRRRFGPARPGNAPSPDCRLRAPVARDRRRCPGESRSPRRHRHPRVSSREPRVLPVCPRVSRRARSESNKRTRVS